MNFKDVAMFEKISFEEFRKECIDLVSDDEDMIKRCYDSIRLPERKTTGSAGYDFVSPFSFSLRKDFSREIPLGIRCKIKEGWFLMMVPRSGLGFKYHIVLDNTIGIIDSDYYNSDNEGHIKLKITNQGDNEIVDIEQGKGICQGIFLPFGIIENDNAIGIRNGGFGSTDQK